MWFQVKVRGRPAHVAYAGRGSNAIEACFPLIKALHELEHRWNDAEASGLRRHTTIRSISSLSKIEGGDWTSIVPSWCTFDMRIGLYPGMDLADVRRAGGAERGRGGAQGHLPRQQPAGDRLSRLPGRGLRAAAGHGGGDAAGAMSSSGARQGRWAAASCTGTTDARFFGLYAGIPAWCTDRSPTTSTPMTSAWNSNRIRRMTQTIALFIADWCGVEAA